MALDIFNNIGLSILAPDLTASEILGTDSSRNLLSLAVATYPSLTELTYVKGVTSALQTQLDLKSPLASPTFTGTVTLPTVTLSGAITASAAYGISGIGSVSLATGGYVLKCDVDNSQISVRGSNSGLGAQWIFRGDTHATDPGGLIFQNTDAAGTGILTRLSFSGKVATSVGACTNLTWTGLDITSTSSLKHSGTQVVGARVIDARCDDVINSGDATTDGVIDALRDAMITHGLIAAA